MDREGCSRPRRRRRSHLDISDVRLLAQAALRIRVATAEEGLKKGGWQKLFHTYSRASPAAAWPNDGMTSEAKCATCARKMREESRSVAQMTLQLLLLTPR